MGTLGSGSEKGRNNKRNKITSSNLIQQCEPQGDTMTMRFQ